MRSHEKIESYRKRSRLYGINVFIAVSLFVCISLISVSDVFAELGNYDINQYSDTTKYPNTYISAPFWEPNYCPATIQDCVDVGATNKTHTGIDYSLNRGGFNAGEKIYSYGFGKVLNLGNTFGDISIGHLLNCGEYIKVNLLHFSNRNVTNNNYISKYQFLGQEGGTGSNGVNTYPFHLHFEVASKVSLAWVQDSLACPGEGCTDTTRTSDYDIDSLIANYKVKSINEPGVPFDGLLWYDPNDFKDYSELLPYLSTSSNPSASSYSVFGYANQKLYSSLTLIRKRSAKTFKQIGILAKKGSNRSYPTNLENDKKWIAQSWSTDYSYDDDRANANPIIIPVTAPNTNASAVEFKNSSQTYSAGDYQFMAFISEFGLTYILTDLSIKTLTDIGIDSQTINKLKTLLNKKYNSNPEASFIDAITKAGVDNTTLAKTIEIDNVDTSYKDLILKHSKFRDDLKGYPITFSVLNSSKDFIVDNDQQENTGYKDACNATENTVPGYYLSAKLPNGKSGVWANWKPTVSGKYNIYVYVPEGIEPQEVVYKIFTKGKGADDSNIPVLSSALNTLSANSLSAENRWVLLESENGESEFTLTNEGYVSLTLSNQAPEATSEYTNSRYDRTNYNISADTEVFLDAIKFVSTDEPITNNQNSAYASVCLINTTQTVNKTAVDKPYYKKIYEGFIYGLYSITLPIQKTRESTPRTITETTTILAEPSLPANRAETLLLAMLVNGNTFEENLPSHYFDVPTTYELYDVIETATKLGIVEGYDGVNEGIFAPENTVTRAEALKIIFKTFNLDLLENSDQGPRGRVWSDSLFYDLDSTHWSYKYAKAAYLYEIMDGFGDGRFAPNANITRSQLVKIVHQAMQLSNSSFKTAGHFIEPEEEDYSSSNNYPSGRVTVTKQSNGNYKLKAECSDPDGQKLSYYWIAQSGSFANISQDDTEVEWIPSASGTIAPIELWVTDGYGLMTQIETETGATPASAPHPVPDTGQTKCHDDSWNEEIPCPKEGEYLYGQDGSYSINPMNYTKLDSTGKDLPITATSWAMVRDNITGWIWENKNNMDGVQDYSNPHDADNTYTWYDSNPSTNGGDAGTAGDGIDTEDFIKALNDANFGGYSDWRLPTPHELSTIIDYGIYQGATINLSFFKDTFPSEYWSNSTSSYYIPKAWGEGYSESWWWGMDSETLGKIITSALVASFYNGGIYKYDKGDYLYAMAVRGEQFHSYYIDNGNGTVTDTSTGIMWQQKTAENSMNWKNALEYCNNLNLANYTDWRLPTIKELRTLINYNRYRPSIDIHYFYDISESDYWSSSTSYGYGPCTWGVNLYYGDDGYGPHHLKRPIFSTTDEEYYVLAVRAGWSNNDSLDNLVISVLPANRTVANSAGSTTFDVSNTGSGTMAWSASVTSGSDWLSIKSGSNGSNSGTITLNYTKNTTTSNRTGTIRVTATGSTGSPKTVTVTQVAGVKESMIITPSSPDATVSASSGFVQLYGASGASNITIEAGGTAKLINFPGSNTITIKGDSTSFKISRSGAMVKFEGSDGTLVQMPATKTAQTIIFNDVSAKLVIENNKVMFGTQVVNITPVAIF